ncbi:hypothetical protein [Candidatus Tisiphia endosymbiont of Oplodontha viridula]|uniref:hypothetical protein n=1 Tax=Candidatus Tisiphia endosymbiont of Oplodontha viridula TaxID=3077925 RepID=UPI0035C90263
MYPNDLKHGDNKQGVNELGIHEVREHANSPIIFTETNSLKQKSIQDEFQELARRSQTIVPTRNSIVPQRQHLKGEGYMRIIFLLFTTLVTLSACNKKVKETIGIVTPGPDEYRVQRNKTLEVPPHYELPSIEKKDTKSHKVYSPKNLNDGEQALIEDMEK